MDRNQVASDGKNGIAGRLQAMRQPRPAGRDLGSHLGKPGPLGLKPLGNGLLQAPAAW
jgi:hypothetical protein